MNKKSSMATGATIILRNTVTRRGVIRTGLGATAAGLTASLGAPQVWARTYPSLGTFPAGVRAKSVFVAGLAPLRGDAADYGATGLNLLIEI